MSWLFVSSGGGHLTQLAELRQILSPVPTDVTWVTYPTRQSRTLLAGERVIPCHWPTTRHLPNAFRNLRLARRVLDDLEPDVVVSTGAGVAVPFLAAAAQRGIPAHYIESATRVDGPSLSGRLLRRVPGVTLYTQHARWAGGRWQHRGSVFDGFRTEPRTDPGPVRRVLVSLGSHASYRFDRLVRRVAAITPPTVQVVWQLGATPAPAGARHVHDQLAAERMAEELAAADAVIAHAGTGIALTALKAGHVPILVPRDPTHREHVDGHQRVTGTWLAAKELAHLRDVNDLNWEDVARATSRRPVRDARSRFHLELATSTVIDLTALEVPDEVAEDIDEPIELST